MFYPITLRRARHGKGQFGAFGRIHGMVRPMAFSPRSGRDKPGRNE